MCAAEFVSSLMAVTAAMVPTMMGAAASTPALWQTCGVCAEVGHAAIAA